MSPLVFLRLLPLWVWPVGALLVWGWMGHHLAGQLRLEQAQQQAAAASAIATAERHERDREQAIQEAQREVNRVEEKRQAQVNATLATADAAVRRLRNRLAGVGPGAAGQHPPTADRSPSTDQLRGALAACVEEYRSLGGAAVAAAAAGERCAGYYDAIGPHGTSKSAPHAISSDEGRGEVPSGY